jgi:hypothetical protein|tara:strand:- start:2435 stop:2665 length:231 start_codon:yes stop_codon:yes gene_type:complete
MTNEELRDLLNKTLNEETKEQMKKEHKKQEDKKTSQTENPKSRGYGLEEAGKDVLKTFVVTTTAIFTLLCFFGESE